MDNKYGTRPMSLKEEYDHLKEENADLKERLNDAEMQYMENLKVAIKFKAKLERIKNIFKVIKSAHSLFVRSQDSIYAATIDDAVTKGLKELTEGDCDEI